MAYIFFALLLFSASVMVHVFYCRSRLKSGLLVKAYILIAVFFMVIYAAGAFLAGHSGIFDPHSIWGLPFKITSGIIFVLLVPLYSIFYTLTQMMSPSKKVLLAVAGRGSLTYAEILESIKEEEFINTRLHDLIISGCISPTKDGYALNPSGRTIAAYLNMMQLIFGRGMGG